MKFKFDVQHILIVIIVLAIIYFIYRYYDEHKVQEKFENQDNQGLAAYYKDSVDENTIEKRLLPSWSTKSISEPTISSKQILKNELDPWTGTYRNFVVGNSAPTNNDTIMVVRKLGNKIKFTVGKRSMQSNTLSGSVIPENTSSYLYYTFNGTAQIQYNDFKYYDSSNNVIGIRVPLNGDKRKFVSKVTSIQTENNTSGISGITTTSNIELKETYDNSTKKWNFTELNVSGPNLTFNQKEISIVNLGTNYGGTTTEVYEYDKELIQPFYKMNIDDNKSNSFKDLNCPFDMKLCNFSINGQGSLGTTNYACANSDHVDVNGNCILTNETNGSTLTSTTLCALGSKTNDEYGNFNNQQEMEYTSSGVTKNVKLNVCSPNFNINIGSYDVMLNKIVDNSNKKLFSCSWLSNMTSDKNYLMFYFYDKKNFSNLTFQYWGESNDESRLLTSKNRLNNLYKVLPSENTFKTFINSLTSLNSGSNDNNTYNGTPVIWKTKQDLGELSCYFTINSMKTNTKPEYYLQAQTNGTVNMTLLEGGFDKYFTLIDTIEGGGTNTKYFAGKLRSSNGLYLSPGNSSIFELIPGNGTNERVCTLTSTAPEGMWVIVCFNPSTFTMNSDSSNPFTA